MATDKSPFYELGIGNIFPIYMYTCKKWRTCQPTSYGLSQVEAYRSIFFYHRKRLLLHLVGGLVQCLLLSSWLLS